MDPVTIGLLGAAALSSAAQIYTNQRNIKYQQEANDTQIGLANTAHQREVRDLEAAGLNPILSASSSGAAVPQLTSPHMENPAGQGVSSMLSSAAKLNSKQVAAQIRQSDSQIGVNDAYAENLRNDGYLKMIQAQVLKEGVHSAESVPEKVEEFIDYMYPQTLPPAKEVDPSMRSNVPVRHWGDPSHVNGEKVVGSDKTHYFVEHYDHELNKNVIIKVKKGKR